MIIHLKRARRRLRLVLGHVRARVLGSRGVTAAPSLTVHGKVHVHAAKGSTIHIEDGVVLNSNVRKNTLEARGPVILKTVLPTARITIGADTGITSSTLSSSCEIAIGERCLIGAGVLITDSDHHVVRPPQGVSRRHLGLPSPRSNDRVEIGDDVFIGARSIVLKGVTIGKGAVIGAGSVVARDIPAGAIAAGNPCVVVGTTEAQ